MDPPRMPPIGLTNKAITFAPPLRPIFRARFFVAAALRLGADSSPLPLETVYLYGW